MLVMHVTISPAVFLLFQVSDPNVVELPDDRIDTYLRAIRSEINPQLQASDCANSLTTASTILLSTLTKWPMRVHIHSCE